jgi:hypothetical protein
LSGAARRRLNATRGMFGQEDVIGGAVPATPACLDSIGAGDYVPHHSLF